MEERMSAGSYDRSLSFQAAEAALREGEASIAAGTACGGGTCPPPAPGGPDIWVADPECDNTPTAGVWTAATALPAPSGPVARTVYAIERVGPAPPPNNPGCGLDGDTSCMVDYFRITACSGDPAAGRAMTILQSNYTP
jgi:type IV pilus assembly protein PilX